MPAIRILCCPFSESSTVIVSPSETPTTRPSMIHSSAESTSSCSTSPRAASLISSSMLVLASSMSLQHRQQHLALIGEGRAHRAGDVLLPDDGQSRFPASGVSRTILHGGFPFLEFPGWQTRFSRIHQENRRPQPSTTAGTPPVRLSEVLGVILSELADSHPTEPRRLHRAHVSATNHAWLRHRTAFSGGYANRRAAAGLSIRRYAAGVLRR